MFSLTTPLLSDHRHKQKVQIFPLAWTLKRVFVPYAPPRLDMRDDAPPPTYDDAEDRVVCVGELIAPKDGHSSSATEDVHTDTDTDTDTDTEDDGEEADEDPIIIVEHIVQRNDTLQGLALRYHTSVRCVQCLVNVKCPNCAPDLPR